MSFIKILLVSLLFTTTLFSSVVVGQKIKQIKLEDQFDKKHQIKIDTKKVIFAFSKEVGHDVNDFLEKQDKNFLANLDTQFIIDLSSAPSIIRSLFIIPKLEKYTYPVLIIKDEDIADNYKDKSNMDKIMIVSLNNLDVKKIDFIKHTKDLKNFLEN